MMEIGAGITIAAPAQRVWKVLNDFGAYPEWNPFMTRMVGEVKPGARFRATVRSPKSKVMNFDAQLVRIIEGQELLFHSTYVKGLLYGDHFFIVEPIDNDRTRFFQSVAFSGMLRPLAGGRMRDAQEGLDRMNEAIKHRCETVKDRP
jgi:hypothetical protein